MFRLMALSVIMMFVPRQGANSEYVSAEPSHQLRGIDVSHHQKIIEWDTVAAGWPVDFAFVKATEGHDFVDSLFCQNWSELKRIGVRRGAYHFFRAYGCGDEQASHFLSLVEMEAGDLLPVLDIEVLDGIAPEVMVQEARIWLEQVEQELGVKPIIYSNQHFFERHLAGHFDDYPLWIARYSEEKPQLSNGKQWDIWQFSNEGCVDGIRKKVDLNIFRGTPDMLERLCWYPRQAQDTNAGQAIP